MNYLNRAYRDGATYNGFLMGNTVGRNGRAIQALTNYWLSPSDRLFLLHIDGTQVRIQTIDDVFKAFVLPLSLEVSESILTEQSKKWQTSTQAAWIGASNA